MTPQNNRVPLNPKSNLCFPVLRQGNRPSPRTSCTKQLYCSNVKQKYLSLKANRADPDPNQADLSDLSLAAHCWQWAGYGSLLTIATPEPWKKSAVFAAAIEERLRGESQCLWCSDPHHSFKPCALPLPSLLSQLKQRTGLPRTSSLTPHPPLSPFFCFWCCSGRSNPRSVKTWTAFLEQHIKFC